MYIAIYLVIYYLLLPTLPCNLLLIFCFLTLILSVKKFWTSVKMWQNYGHEFVASLFLPTLWSGACKLQYSAVQISRLLTRLRLCEYFRRISKYLFVHLNLFLYRRIGKWPNIKRSFTSTYDHETITFLNWRSFYHTNNRQSSQYIALTTVTQKHRTYDCPCTSN